MSDGKFYAYVGLLVVCGLALSGLALAVVLAVRSRRARRRRPDPAGSAAAPGPVPSGYAPGALAGTPAPAEPAREAYESLPSGLAATGPVPPPPEPSIGPPGPPSWPSYEPPSWPPSEPPSGLASGRAPVAEHRPAHADPASTEAIEPPGYHPAHADHRPAEPPPPEKEEPSGRHRSDEGNPPRR
jgi:hypothetical protein